MGRLHAWGRAVHRDVITIALPPLTFPPLGDCARDARSRGRHQRVSCRDRRANSPVPMRRVLCLAALAAAAAESDVIRQPRPCTTKELLTWRQQLAQVRAMRSRDMHEASKVIRLRNKNSDEPTFSRLFTHETWRDYVSDPPLHRWWRYIRTWQMSTVASAIMPCVLILACWAALVSLVDQRWPTLFKHVFSMFRPITSVPVELQGTAIGLLVVFRTNNAHERLAEARATLGRALCLSRELAQSIACTWPLAPLYEEPEYDNYRHASVVAKYGYHHHSLAGSIGGDVGSLGGSFPDAVGGLPRLPSLDVARYLVAFAWSLKAELREPARAESIQSPDDVLRTLLPESEVQALLGLSRTNIPFVLLGRLRLLLADCQRAGTLQPHVHLKLEEDLRELNSFLADNQRLFHSPIPPTMSRHVARCLMLWLSLLPFALCGRLPPLGNAIATAITTYIFVGMEEIGVGVEQPFESMPLWQLCHIMAHDAEAAIAGDAPGHVEGSF